MSLPTSSTEINAQPNRQSEAASGQQRSALLFARVGCAVVAALGIGLFVATLPTYIAYLYQPCVSASCIYGQLSESGIETLRSLGLSLSAYAIMNVTLVIITGLLCTAVAALLLWRKSNSWVAVLVAFLLVVLGVTNTIISPPILQPLLGERPGTFIADFANFLGAISLPLLFSLFPNGRFVPRWTLWVAVASIVPAVMLTILPPLVTVPAILPTLSEIFFSLGAFCLIGAQIYRYRRVSTPVER